MQYTITNYHDAFCLITGGCVSPLICSVSQAEETITVWHLTFSDQLGYMFDHFNTDSLVK